ncbi:MAG TPA: hypothetical protein DGD08_13755 [Gemmatimonas aurantiaca]|uniref:Uncharacterized protein n=2 Tax=Gemmatimonas aurantiaca TaxID=173480 RepID=C1AAC9_GEMAT|nr:hypothetical protein [Gemmatimonas aurantiaca]BAH39727.1 hypothetical protein GAU_2685 [Gemmatimonas aurantiaca T-27]HCT58263.1 hypothetical protein [Gemmatimonas aurantiaca]
MAHLFRISDVRWSDADPRSGTAGGNGARQMTSVEAECRSCDYPFTASSMNRWLAVNGSSAVVMCPKCHMTEVISGTP